MTIAAGKLDRRLKLYRRSTTTNALNEDVETFTLFATVWASKHDVSDGERVQAAQVSAEITTRFQIRYSETVSSLNPKDRVWCAGREYEVTAVKEMGRQDGLEISAVARADKLTLHE